MHRYARAFVVIGILFMSGCALPARGQVLNFTTFAQGTDNLRLGSPSRNGAPVLQIISAKQQVDQVCQTLTVTRPPSPRLTALQTQLHGVSYDDAFVIIALQGTQGSGGNRIDIQQVVQQPNRVLVEAQFTEPKRGEAVTGEITDPYHVIVIAKGALRGTMIRFDLLSDGKTVASITHTVA